VDFVSKKDDFIVHHISNSYHDQLKLGDKIEGKIDWDYRFGIMRAHSSQHILSAIFKNEYNIDTMRANISFEEVVLYISKSVNKDELENVFQQFSRFCTIENLPFKSKLISHDGSEDLNNIIRGKIPEEKMLRVIEIEDYDINCCGGTHVRNSVEIGPIYFFEIKKGSEFKYHLGKRAIKMLTKNNIEIIDLASSLNIPINAFPLTFKNQIYKLRDENEGLSLKILELISNSPTTILNGVKIGILNFDINFKLLSKKFKDFPPNYLLIIEKGENNIQILSNNENIKANDIIQDLIKKYGGKGGGSPRSAQATLENELKDIISELQLLFI